MLKKFLVRNYKNFKKNVIIDFSNIAGYQFSTDCISEGLISKMLIYGKNATGKTNLGTAILDIVSTLSGFQGADEDVFLNADSEEDYALFSYTFQFGKNEMIYKYTKLSNRKLRDEELEIDGILIFRCSFIDKKYNFDNLNYINAETINVKRYLQALESDADPEEFVTPKLSFLRWIINNTALKDDSILLKLSDYVGRMVMATVSNPLPIRLSKTPDPFWESIEDFEEFLNMMGIECKLALKKLPDGKNELYFWHHKLVPFFRNASSGTLSLTNLYRRFISVARAASFIYLDEFDAFYHYEMSVNVIKYFKAKFPQCQIIMTSHNTNLMTNRLMRPDCLFILSGEGILTSLCNATVRELREGHNLEKMYISGEFEKYE